MPRWSSYNPKWTEYQKNYWIGQFWDPIGGLSKILTRKKYTLTKPQHDEAFMIKCNKNIIYRIIKYTDVKYYYYIPVLICRDVKLD